MTLSQDRWGLRLVTQYFWYFLLASVSLIPFYYLQPVGRSSDLTIVATAKYFPVLVIACIATLTLWRWQLRYQGWDRWRLDTWGLAACLYVAMATLSITNAEFAWLGALKLLYYTVTGVLLALLLVLQAPCQKALYALARCMVLLAIVVSVYGIIVYVSGKDYLFWKVYGLYNPNYAGVDRIVSTLGNPNYVGSYLALCLPYCLWLFRCARSGAVGPRIMYAGCVGIVVVGLWLTFSRGGWLAGSVAIGVCVSFGSNGGEELARRTFRARKVLAGVMAMLLLCLVIGRAAHDGVAWRAWNQSVDAVGQIANVAQTQAYRLAQYGTAWRILKEYPALGVGFGNLTGVSDRYMDPAIVSPRVKTTDNMYLMVACESGILGLITFLAMLFVLARIIYGSYQTTPPGRDRTFRLCTLAAFCGFMVNMVTWDALNQPTVRITFWTLVGIALSQAGNPRPRSI